MKNLWNDTEAESLNSDPMALRVYTSRLLGQDTGLVLHGGGNTSVKIETANFFGDVEEVLYVKGSGRDLATIDADGFAPVRLNVLKRMVELDHVSDADMVRLQKAAITRHPSPDPSIEAILHAIIPFTYVDHTHADAVVTLTNTEKGESLIREIYGDRILIVPYITPGFKLGKSIHRMVRPADWDRLDGIIILHHGMFTFSNDARTSYERMVHLATLAEEYLRRRGAFDNIAKSDAGEDLQTLSRIRRLVSMEKGSALLARLDASPEACGFAGIPGVATVAARGPITADHLIRIKPFPIFLGKDIEQETTDYASSYRAYFNRNTDGRLTSLDAAPRWAIWPKYGTIAFGKNMKDTTIVSDIVRHTIRAIQWGETIGEWVPLPEKEMFHMEYWELQQAKLHGPNIFPVLQGKVAMVTGAASGIGLACAKMLHEQGAAVVGLDLNPDVSRMLDLEDLTGIFCDVADDATVTEAVEMTVRRFGGLDILIQNAGIFPDSQAIEALDPKTWERSLTVNLTSQQRLLKTCIPYLKQGIDPAVVFISSKNVPAPGPGAAAYSVAKAGQTQLARIAAMELGPFGIRVNIVHPDAVYDTALWTPEVLERRACQYGCTVEAYKTRNILKTEVSSKDVAALVSAMVGPAFAKTTGAQVPIDGGNDRVI